MEYQIRLSTVHQTMLLAERLSQTITLGMVIGLDGDLGMGKTTLVRGILESLGVREKIKSPTYALVESYPVAWAGVEQQFVDFHHFDLYRLDNAIDWLECGFDEYINPYSICCIEWVNQAKSAIATIDLNLSLVANPDSQKDHSRIVILVSNSKKGDECLSQLILSYENL